MTDRLFLGCVQITFPACYTKEAFNWFFAENDVKIKSNTESSASKDDVIKLLLNVEEKQHINRSGPVIDPIH